MKKKRNICVLDINNFQEDYSFALEFIEVLENIQSESEYKNKLDSIHLITEKISVRGGQVQAGLSAIYYEKPIIKTEPRTKKVISTEYLIADLKKLTYSMFEHKMIPFFMKKDMLYHIRIHTKHTNDNFSNLQYLALFLQRLSFMFEGLTNSKKRLSVFIVPSSADLYPFIDSTGYFDNQTYVNASKYLYLLSNEYKGVIFGATIGKNKKVDIEALNFKITIQPNDYFPIIPMNEKNYCDLFEKSVSFLTLKEVFSLMNNVRKRNFRTLSEVEAEDAFYDYIAESSFRKLEDMLGYQEREEKEKLLTAIYKVLIEKIKKVHWISFALFCFLFQKIDMDKENVESSIMELWKMIQNLFDGIKQIVQNAVQHSEKRSCIFSFYMQDNAHLRILISDLNYSRTIVEKLADTLEAEYKDCENEIQKNAILNLINKKETIALRNLFGEFGENDSREEWKEFRKLNSSAHVGLMLLNVTAIRCNAKVSAHSCTDYLLNSCRDYYIYRCQDNKVKEYDNIKLYSRVIPGTQYTIEIPIMGLQKNIPLGLGQIHNKSYIQEDYETFADYLEYKEEELKCAIKFREICDTLTDKTYVCIAEKKLTIIRKWRKKWKEILTVLCEENDEKIYYIDMGKINRLDILSDTDDLEIFIKSFFEAIVDINIIGVRALALTNVDNEFMRVFKDMCIVFAAREFPDKFQLFICSDNYVDSLILFGNSFYEAIHNGYLLAIEHGTREIGVFEYARVRDLYYKINNINTYEGTNKKTNVKVIPFDTILSCDNKVKLFDKRITMMSDAEIDGDIPGYRISNTHMRLGSKVHIQSFYEMSFLFYRTSIANRIAFEILQNLIDGESFPEIDVNADTLIFYGYASYSKAILTSIVEILNIYRGKKAGGGEAEKKVAFISYQHNLQSESENVQMYYGFPEGFAAEVINGFVMVKESIKVVQIVPISSTLTTFEKMWGRLKKDVISKSLEKLMLMANYSVYWVMHTNKTTEVGKPSPLERKYWCSYNAKEHLITTNFKELNSKIYYFNRQPVIWNNPLSCKMCYPQNVLDEVPLVETDQTSTVPTQQIRKRKKKGDKRNVLIDNDERFLKLEGSIVYGHIKRGKNHFQYYVDTQSYFYSVRTMVRKWLEECRKNDEFDIDNVDFPCIHVLFSPEHNTNVGFAQYVNTYYFGGVAEVISINEDKEFRSNFECEHTALMHTIEHLLSNIIVDSQKEMPVKFYFADDTIISGESFQKANSFLRTLLPVEYKHRYSTNIISKCFLLVDRMSNDTKRNYVANVEHDFHSFLHIDVSNVRTQGDSCVGCKLEKDAIRLFKRSSTNHVEAYWSSKMIEYEPISYDDKEKLKPYQNKQAFHRLLISHISQNIIFVDNDYFEYGSIYDSILAIAFRILGNNESKLKNSVTILYDRMINEVQGVDSLFMFFKIISRPFFAFDYKVKSQVLTLLIILMEILLGNEKQIKEYNCETESVKIYKSYLLEKHRIALTVKLGKLIATKIGAEGHVNFIQNCLIRCLADMRSTYLIRKNTIRNIYQYLCKKDKKEKNGGAQIFEDFWYNYAYHVHYIVDCSNDEMRSLGLEYLLLTGKEYSEFIDDAKEKKEAVFTPLFLYECITGKKTPKSRDSFYIFCHELLLQNTRIHFDGLEKDSKRHNEQDSYYMEQWSCVRSLEQFKIYGLEDYPKNQQKVMPTDAERGLFEYLKKGNDNTISLQEVKNKYDNLLKKIADMIHQKQRISLNKIRMALLTLSHESNVVEAIGDLDILTEINANEANERYKIKSQIVEMLNKNQTGSFDLRKDGYAILESGDKKPCIVIYFKNQHKATENQVGRTMRTIAKVLLYISIEANTENESFYYPRFILRDILVYKNRIMRMLETDFASDMFTKYAHTTDEKNIFAHEKAINHNSIRDNDELQMLLEKHTVSEKYDVLGYNECIKWLTLKNYVNEQIARLFNRCFRMQSEVIDYVNNNGVRMEAPQLYIGEKENEYLNENPFCRKLNYFKELNFLQDDRFILLMEVVCIEYENLVTAEVITKIEDSGIEKAYNQEYMKCLIFDILLSAIKSGSYRPGFLEKINWYLKGKMWIAAKGMLDEVEVKELQDDKCVVRIYREECQDECFDYLVFQNRVILTIPNFEEANRDIYRRLQDPLDYSDGHMSLLTIKKYIEGLRPELENKTVFEYAKRDGALVFMTKLPILKKGDVNYEENIYAR